MADVKKVDELLRAWEEGPVKKTLAKNPERKPVFRTTSDIEVKRLYVPETCDADDYAARLGMPGEYPYTRGVQPTMFRGRFWTFRQYSGFGDAFDTNKRYRYLLDQGQTGLSVAFDLPTQMGYDSDHPLAAGEVGKVGVAISSLDDMEVLLSGIPLDRVTTSMTINSTAAILLSFYMAVAEKQGIALDKIGGTIQNDILKEYMARGTYIYPPEPSMRIIADVFAYCAKHVPKWNTISISGYHIREAGCSAVQEIAFTLADGIAYVQAAIDAGLGVDDFAGRLSFFFNSHLNFLEEAAKFRAARRMWARIMRERFGAKKPSSWLLRFHTQTAGSSLTAQQPENNIIRTAWQAMAAVLGGTQSLHTNSMDEALSLPTEKAVKIALRTQHLIAHESGITDTVDPLAGSYFVEALTDELEKRAWEYIGKIDAMGGMVRAIMAGYPQKEIQDKAYQYQLEIEEKARIIVGINQFTEPETPMKDVLRINPAIEESQRKRLSDLRARRDASQVEQRLAALTRAAKGTDNVVPYIFESVKAGATLGEVADALRAVFGQFKEVLVV
jgi:methylmalonyl-CoA mutase N-terminal domain/subunit